MPRTAARITQADVARASCDSVVYFAKIGKHIKVGYSTNLQQRLKAFETTTAGEVYLLASIPGGRAEETRLHRALADTRIRGEFFHHDWRLDTFIHTLKSEGAEAAWRFLDQSDPEQQRRRAEKERLERIAAARKIEADKDAYFAALVAERKRVRGW